MAESFEVVLKLFPSQIELATSIGLSPLQSFRYVILPQALAISLPLAPILSSSKETSVFSAVALADLMYVAKDLIGLYYETDEALFMLVIAYLILLLPISLAFSLIERRLRFAGFGNTSTLSGK